MKLPLRLRRLWPNLLVALGVVTALLSLFWILSTTYGVDRDLRGLELLDRAAAVASPHPPGALTSARIEQGTIDRVMALIRGLGLLVAGLSLLVGVLAWHLVRTTVKFSRAAAMKRESQYRYRFLAEGIPSVGIARFSLEQGRFLDANRAVFRLLGKARAQIVGQPIAGFIQADDVAAFEESLRQLQSEQENLECVVRMEDAAGIMRDIAWHVARPGGESQREGFAILVDVTERRRAEEERLERERLAGVLEMAGAAAHEINQPLQVLLGFTEMLAQEIPGDNPVQPKIERLRQEVTRISHIGRKIAGITHYRVKDYVGETKIIDIDRASRAK